MKKVYIHTRKTYRAISLLEVILSISILAFVVLAVVGIVGAVVQDASDSVNRNKTIFLAEAGHEYVRDLRDAYFEDFRADFYLRFDGEESYVDLNNREDFDIDDQITITGRINPSQEDTQGYVLSKQTWFESGGGGPPGGGHPRKGGYGLYWDGENNRLGFYTGHTDVEYSEEVFTGYDEWIHVGVTLDNEENLSFYKNGELVGTQEDVELRSNEEPLYFGNRPQGGEPSHLFEGLLFDLRIYDEALQQSDIELLHDGDNIQSGLIGHWMLNEGYGETVYDKTANGNNGDINEAEWIQEGFSLENWSGVDNTFLYSKGVEAFVNCDHEEDFDITDEISISARVKPSQENMQGYVLSKETWSGEGGYGLYWDGENNRLRFYHGNEQVAYSAETFTEYDEWVYVGVTLNNDGDLSFYKNGELKNTVYNVYLNSNEDPLYIADRPQGGDSVHVFEGFLHDVRLYDRSLEINELDILHSGGDVENNLLGHWNLNDGYGHIAKDYSNNENDCEINDPEWFKRDEFGFLNREIRIYENEDDPNLKEASVEVNYREDRQMIETRQLLGNW